MKQTFRLLLMLLPLATIFSCNNLDFKRTKTGLLYQIFTGSNSKDSLARPGDIIKFNVTSKLNDSLLYSSYDKAPQYQQVASDREQTYSPAEIFPMLRKGDSAVTVALVDTLIARGQQMQLPPGAKKGDRFTVTFKILEVFNNDSLARADYDAEMKKDEPRRIKEAEEQQAKMQKQREEEMKKEMDELQKSGEIDKELKAMEAYLAEKNIKAQKTGMGVFVEIKKQGNGPQVEDGKIVEVKYTGRILATDSVFESSTYTFPLGKGQVIQGWDQGLKLFRKGGAGTLYIPGFLAYGKNVGAGSPFKPFEALIFDVEVMDVKDAAPASAN